MSAALSATVLFAVRAAAIAVVNLTSAAWNSCAGVSSGPRSIAAEHIDSPSKTRL